MERASERWVLAAVWVTLPITGGGALADATDAWSTAMQVTLAVLAWGAWAGALLAILVPRPIGLTATRVVAPAFAAGALLVGGLGAAGTTSAVLAVAATLASALLAARPALALAAANGAAYGDEARFPLRVPPALFLGPLPLTRLLLAAAVTTGPLLLADRRWVAGAVALVVGLPVAALAARAVHGLSTRWVILVPAGLVVLDPLTLSDPVLFLRERIRVLAPLDPRTPPAPTDLDLRLGATLGSLVLHVDRPAEVFRAVRTRRGAQAVTTEAVVVAAVSAPALLVTAAARRIPVGTLAPAGGGQAATPPPSSSSPS